MAGRAGSEIVLDVAAPGGGGDGGGFVSLHHLRSWTGGMGSADIECVRHCSCAPLVVDAHEPAVRASQTRSAWLRVDTLSRCHVRVRVRNETSSEGGHRFKLSGLAVGLATR